MDVEMETEKEAAESSSSSRPTAGEAPSHPHHQQPRQDGAVEGSVRGLLVQAQQLIHEGKPSLALQAVLMAVKTEAGDNAVFQMLHRARELYRNKVQAHAADELASLFAECVIAEAEPTQFSTQGAAMPLLAEVQEGSILAESGRMQIVLDAVSDGSSFICLQCGGLVSNLRRDEHLAHWCCGRRI